MKLSKRQAEVLGEIEKGTVLNHGTFFYPWLVGVGRVHWATFDSLCNKGCIECTHKAEDGHTDIYTITPAGIAALKEGY